MMVVDASVWMSYLVPADSHHAITRRWLVTVLTDGTPLAAPVLLLAEVGGAIARITGKSELGRQAIDQLLSFPLLRLVSLDHEFGISVAHLAADQRLRGSDATYVGVAVALKVPLISWDSQQLERASSVADVAQPG